jgi:hypothetical protein
MANTKSAIGRNSSSLFMFVFVLKRIAPGLAVPCHDRDGGQDRLGITRTKWEEVAPDIPARHARESVQGCSR